MGTPVQQVALRRLKLAKQAALQHQQALQHGQMGEARFRTVPNPPAPPPRGGRVAAGGPAPAPAAVPARAAAPEAAPAAEPPAMPAPTHRRVECDGEGGGQRQEGGSQHGGSGGEPGGSQGDAQQGQGGGGQGGQGSSGGDDGRGRRGQAALQAGAGAAAAALASDRPAGHAPGAQGSARQLLQRLAGADTAAQLRAMADHLRHAPAAGPLATLAGVKRLLQDHAPEPRPAGTRGPSPALLPLQLLVCAAPRTPAQRGRAEARLRAAGSPP